MSDSLFECGKDVKVFGWRWNGSRGHNLWFVYANHKFNYVERTARGMYSSRPAISIDWMNIGGDDSDGFVDCDIYFFTLIV